MKIWLLIALAFAFAAPAIAHSGGTDANGCHNETKTGGWHCH